MSFVPSRSEISAADQASPDPVSSSAAGPAALRGSALRSAGYATTMLLSLVSAPLLIRHLGIAAFGRYTTVIALTTIVGGLTDAGLLNVAMREWATHRGQRRWRIMRSLLGIRLELSLAGVVVGVAFAALAGYDHVMVIGTLIAGIGMFLQVTSDFLTAALQGELRFGWASIVDVVRQAVAVALIVVLVLVGAGLLPFLAVTVPSAAVAVGLTAVLVRGRMPLTPQLRGGERWTLIRETLPYAAAIAVNTLYFRVTIVVMSLIAAAEQTGYFATSFRVTTVLVGVPALAVGAAFPILSRAAQHDTDRFAYATERILELALIAGTALALVVVLSAPFVIQVLAGSSGAPASAVLQIQGTALIATFVSVATGYALLSLRRHRALLVANVSALIANIVLTLALVPIDHARGAAIAAVTAETCLALGQLALLLRLKRTRLRIGPVIAVAAAGLAGAAALLLPVHPVLRTLTGLVVYVGLLALFGIRLPELVDALERRRSADLR